MVCVCLLSGQWSLGDTCRELSRGRERMWAVLSWSFWLELVSVNERNLSESAGILPPLNVFEMFYNFLHLLLFQLPSYLLICSSQDLKRETDKSRRYQCLSLSSPGWSGAHSLAYSLRRSIGVSASTSSFLFLPLSFSLDCLFSLSLHH